MGERGLEAGRADEEVVVASRVCERGESPRAGTPPRPQDYGSRGPPRDLETRTPKRTSVALGVAASLITGLSLQIRIDRNRFRVRGPLSHHAANKRFDGIELEQRDIRERNHATGSEDGTGAGADGG